jgi:hypothetical protein
MSNYIELYKKNLNFDKTSDYSLLQKYEMYIKNPKKVKCPFDKKDNVIIVNNEDNNEILIKCKENDKWFLNIKKSKSINLYKKLETIRNNRNSILNNISNYLDNDLLNITNFNKLKEEYKNINNTYNEILEIFKLQKIELDIIKNEIIDLKFKIGNLYYEKINEYELIKSFFNLELNREIKKIYFKDSKLEEKEIKDFSIKHKIPIDNTKKILKWYELNKEYIKLNNELGKKELLLKSESDKIENINFNFLVIFPVIKENEILKNKNKKFNSIKIKK